MFRNRSQPSEADATATHSSSYRARHPWPPDFSKMDAKEQFRLERRYRRRAKLAYSRPTWVRRVKLAQYAACSGVAFYGVFFMEWGQDAKPFEGLRQWMRNTTEKLWQATGSLPPRPDLRPISERSSPKAN